MTKDQEAQVRNLAPEAQILVVDSLVTTPAYSQLVTGK